MTMALTQPARCLLDETQLAAALALAGVTRTADSPLPHGNAPADPRTALRGSAIIEGDGVAPGWSEALAVLAAPNHVVSIAAGVAGAAAWVQAVISCGVQDGPYVAHPGDGRFDLALLPTTMDAVLYADELLGITEGPSGEGEEGVPLSLPAVAAFGALADAMQQARLRALLDRSAAPRDAWTTADLQQVYAAGMTHEDTRWASTALRHVTPFPQDETGATIPQGLDEIAAAGWVASRGDHWTLTPAGRERAAEFGQLVNAGVISSAALDTSGAPSMAAASVFRTVLGVWLMTWNTAAGSTVGVLEEVTSGQALEVVWRLLRPSV